MRAFAQAERFVSELESRKLRPAYVFVGDEAFFRKRFRDAILDHLVPADLRDFSLFDFDLSETDLGRGSGPRPHAIADGSFPGLLRARSEESFRPRIERRKAGRHRGLLQKSQSRRAGCFCRRPHQHSCRRSQDGDAGQGALPAHPRHHGPVLRHRRTGAGGRRRSGALDHRLLHGPRK